MIIYYKIRAFLVTWFLRLIPRIAPIVFKGANSSLTLCEQIAVLDYRKVLIVTDEFIASSGMLNAMQATLEKHNVAFTVFEGVLPDPSFEQVQAGQRVLATKGCECILAVGGGSVLDAAKMIALLHTNPGDLASFGGDMPVKNPGVPLFTAPTTAGTGSEITLVAVITDSVTQEKVPVIDSKLIPGYIALDGVLMKSMPKGITAATGMDALTHAVESYLATSSHEISEVQATAAVRLVFKYLLRAWRDGDDMEARDGMALAAFYAGSAFGRTSVGYVHGIAHQLGRVCGAPHGNANAMGLPQVLEAYGPCVHDRLADLARVANTGEAGDNAVTLAKGFIDAVYHLRTQMDMPLQPKGLSLEHLDDIVSQAIKETGRMYPVPRYLSRDELMAIVKPMVPTPASTDRLESKDGLETIVSEKA